MLDIEIYYREKSPFVVGLDGRADLPLLMRTGTKLYFG
jgi:hypothetical protein